MKNFSMIKKCLFNVVSVQRRSSDQFFEYIRGHSFTVNSGPYGEMIRDFVIPDFRENGMEGYWFQQDGAT